MAGRKKITAGRLKKLAEEGARVNRGKPAVNEPEPERIADTSTAKPAPPPQTVVGVAGVESAVNRVVDTILESQERLVSTMEKRMRPAPRPGKVSVKVSNLVRDRNKRLESFDLDFSFSEPIRH